MSLPKTFALSLLAAVALGQPARATGGAHGSGPAADAPPRSAVATARYPQPVRVADLAGRQLLEDRPNQRVLGHVSAIVAGADGTPSLLVQRRRWWGGDAGRVAVPVASVALLGQFLVLKDLDPERFSALPAETAAMPQVIPATEVLRIGLARN